MFRSIASVAAGAALWAALWVSGNAGLAAAFPTIIRQGEPMFHVPVLWTYIAWSVVLSIAAGYVTALVAKRSEMQHALALGILQLGIGVATEISYWELLPVWYHLVFLTLLVPGNLLGGWMRVTRRLEPKVV